MIVGAVSPYAIPAVPRDAVAGDEEKEQGLEMRLELEEEGYKIPLPLSIGISPSKIIILKLTFLRALVSRGRSSLQACKFMREKVTFGAKFGWRL